MFLSEITVNFFQKKKQKVKNRIKLKPKKRYKQGQEKKNNQSVLIFQASLEEASSPRE